MAVSSRQNQNMMNLIRKVHGLVERPDLTKHRQSQDRIGAILGTEKGIAALRLVGCTTGRELHPALKISIKLSMYKTIIFLSFSVKEKLFLYCLHGITCFPDAAWCNQVSPLPFF